MKPSSTMPQKFIVLLFPTLCSWAILLGWLLIVLQEKYFLITAPALLPMGFFVYSRLHNHFHEGYQHGKRLFETYGIALSAILGLSWSLYLRHHANHHQFNNGPGDFARTMEPDGTFSNGTMYILRTALKPYILQLVPFLALLGMKKQNRTAVAYLDESLRVMLRLMAFGFGGIYGLFGILVWQLTFMIFLMYSNYLQHFYVPIGNGVVWNEGFFNFIFAEIGWHDQHHFKPSLLHGQLKQNRSRTIPRKRMGLFDPIAFVCFLWSPRLLAKRLQISPKS
jgi:hypothetical protein